MAGHWWKRGDFRVNRVLRGCKNIYLPIAVAHLRLVDMITVLPRFLTFRNETTHTFQKYMKNQARRIYKPIRACASDSISGSVPVPHIKDHVRATRVPVYRIRSQALR